jgi:hypothetical protein
MNPLPVFPLPDVNPPPDLFYRTRRRAKVRKARLAAVWSLSAVVLFGGSAFGLGQLPSGRSDTLTTPVTQPSTTPPTDAELLAMAQHCNACQVATRLEVGDRTFAVLGSHAAPPLARFLRVQDVVLARGTQLLSELTPTAPAGLVHGDARPDGNGNALVAVSGGNNSLWWLPFRLTRDQLALTQGTFTDVPLNGDLNSGLVTIGQRTRIVTVNHQAQPDGTRRYTYRAWDWDGAAYVAHPCTPTRTSPNSCGLRAYPFSPG